MFSNNPGPTPLHDLHAILAPYGDPPSGLDQFAFMEVIAAPDNIAFYSRWFAESSAHEIDRAVTRIFVELTTSRPGASEYADIAARASALRSRREESDARAPSLDYITGVGEGIDLCDLTSQRTITTLPAFYERTVQNYSDESFRGCVDCARAYDEMWATQAHRTDVTNAWFTRTPSSSLSNSAAESPYTVLLNVLKTETERRTKIATAKQSTRHDFPAPAAPYPNRRSRGFNSPGPRQTPPYRGPQP